MINANKYLREEGNIVNWWVTVSLRADCFHSLAHSFGYLIYSQILTRIYTRLISRMTPDFWFIVLWGSREIRSLPLFHSQLIQHNHKTKTISYNNCRYLYLRQDIMLQDFSCVFHHYFFIIYISTHVLILFRRKCLRTAAPQLMYNNA